MLVPASFRRHRALKMICAHPTELIGYVEGGGVENGYYVGSDRAVCINPATVVALERHGYVDLVVTQLQSGRPVFILNSWGKLEFARLDRLYGEQAKREC